MNFYRATPVNAAATNASFNSSPIESVSPSYMFRFSAIAKASHSSANGTLQLQASNEEPNSSGTYTKWVNVGSSAAVSGTTAVMVAQAIEVCYARIRFVFTDSSGGTSTALLSVDTMSFTF